MANKQQGDIFPDFDFTKYLGDFKVPGIDVETVIASQRKNIEALTQANRVAYEGFQAVVRRQVEILRQAIDEASRATKDMTEPGTAQDKAAKQADLAKDVFERALANARELAEMVARSNTEAFDLLNKRFSQTLDELRDSFVRSGKK